MTLRAVAAANRPAIPGLGRRPGVGVYATVVGGGRVAVADSLSVPQYLRTVGAPDLSGPSSPT